ncbi:hypothetical protein Tco_1140183 [Tanacetum coccineum]
MKRASKGYIREDIPLFPAMIVQGLVVQGEGSTHPVESHHTPTNAPSISQPPVSLTSRRTTRQEFVVSQPRSPTQTLVADKTVHEERGDSVERAATTATSLDVEQGSGGSPKRQDTILGDRPAQTRLIKKVKNLENTVKSSQARRRARIIVSDDEDDLEDPSKQGRKIAEIDPDLSILLVQHDVGIQGRYKHDMEFNFVFDAAKEVSTVEKDVSTAEQVSTAGATVTTASVAVSTASPTRNTRVSTADDITMAETLVYIRRSATKEKGKGKMDESEKVITQTKLQQKQERLDFEASMRLQDELDQEGRKRISMVHESASSFNVEEWEDIQARVQADEELA